MILFYISMIEDADDRDLAGNLYAKYRQAVYKMALGYLRNPYRAEEAVSDVFERICKNIVQFRGLVRNKTKALIVVYSRNVFSNILKRDKIITFEELEEDVAAEQNPTENMVLDQDSYARILRLVEQLDDKYADVCRLKFFVGLEDPEIAGALNISHESVRVRLHRARAMLRERLIREGMSI